MTLLHTSSEVLSFTRVLSEVCTDFADNPDFIRVGHSYLINRLYISSFTESEITMTDSTVILIPSRLRKAICQNLREPLGCTCGLLIFFQKKERATSRAVLSFSDIDHSDIDHFAFTESRQLPDFYIASTTASSTSSNVSMVSFNVSASSSVIASWEISPISFIMSAV